MLDELRPFFQQSANDQQAHERVSLALEKVFNDKVKESNRQIPAPKMCGKTFRYGLQFHAKHVRDGRMDVLAGCARTIENLIIKDMKSGKVNLIYRIVVRPVRTKTHYGFECLVVT